MADIDYRICKPRKKLKWQDLQLKYNVKIIETKRQEPNTDEENELMELLDLSNYLDVGGDSME